MDPNTLNLKNQNASQSIPTVQGSNTPHSVGGTGMYAQTPEAPGEAVYAFTPEQQASLDGVQKELATRFELLPPDIQQTIISSDYQMKLFDLAKKYQLTYIDLGQLELETTMVLLGMTHPQDFLGDLKVAIKKDDKTMDALVNDIDEQVFSAIRASLIKLHEEETAERESGGPAPVADYPSSLSAVPLAQELASKAPETTQPNMPGQVDFGKVEIQKPAPAPVQSTAPLPTLEKHEDDMMKNSGIDLGTGTTAPANTNATVTSADSFTSKLTGVFGVKSKSTDHTLPKIGEGAGTINNSLPKQSGADPYREQL